jgi:hypothetical protein
LRKISGNFIPNFRERVANGKNYKPKIKQRKGMTPRITPMKTSNSSTCGTLFAASLGALCLIALSTQAATITVTNTNDNGSGSLRQAIAGAHNGDTIDFGVAGTISLSTGELLVDKSVTINGPGAASLTIDGNATGRVFHVSSGVTAAVARLTITNGTGWEDDLTNSGGGIYNDHATLALDNCTVSGNTASWGGGGINNSSGTLTNSTLSGNWAGRPQQGRRRRRYPQRRVRRRRDADCHQQHF